MWEVLGQLLKMSTGKLKGKLFLYTEMLTRGWGCFTTDHNSSLLQAVIPALSLTNFCNESKQSCRTHKKPPWLHSKLNITEQSHCILQNYRHGYVTVLPLMEWGCSIAVSWRKSSSISEYTSFCGSWARWVQQRWCWRVQTVLGQPQCNKGTGGNRRTDA